MVEINEHNYPIVSVKFEGIATSEETETYLERFGNWLSQENPFGLILHQSQAKPQNAEETNRAKESHKLVVRWAKQNKPKISQYCVGMAVVSDLSKMPKHQQVIAPKALGVLFGCPGQVFGTQTDAEKWIEQQMCA